MKLPYLLQQIYYEPALILPEAAASIRMLVEAHLGLGEQGRGPATDRCGEQVDVEQMQIVDGIAHIPIGGAIGQKLKPFQRGQGAVDVADVAAEIVQAESDPTVRGTIFHIDSPGGMVSGTPELASQIAAMKKPKYAYTDGMMASAAYWIGAATDGIFATPTANVGSIGVYMPWIDQSRAFEAAGLKVELIKAGKLKGMGFPGTSLSDDQRAHLQDRVNSIYAMFKDHVCATRGDIADSVMQGQTFMAGEAMKHGLIDAIVSSKAEVAALIPAAAS
jgi:signal peptide peptidase SppA